MAAINLLPTDLAPKGEVVKAANTIKSLIVGALAVFLITVFGLIGYLLVGVFEIRNSETKQEQLKVSIRTLEQSEQRLVLLKDRLAKVKLAFSSESADEEAENIQTVLSAATSVGISELELKPLSIEVSVVAQSSSQLSSFLSFLENSDIFENIKVSSFGFNPTAGYIVSMELKEK